MTATWLVGCELVEDGGMVVGYKLFCCVRYFVCIHIHYWPDDDDDDDHDCEHEQRRKTKPRFISSFIFLKDNISTCNVI